MKSIPLYIAYVLFPLVMIGERLLSLGNNRNWIELVWGATCVLPLLAIMFRRGRVEITLSKRGLVIGALLTMLVLFLVVRLALVAYSTHVYGVPLVMEVKPFFYLLVAAWWVLGFGLLEREQFIRAGAGLGIIIFLDFLVESALAGHISRPRGSGEINYDACLLLLALALSIERRGARLWPVAWIGVGLLATFSRTALLAAILVFLLLGPVSRRNKVIIAGVLGVFIVFSFMLRGLPLDNVETMDRYWMWVTWLSLLWSSPGQSLWGFSIGSPLPVHVPKAVEWLWTTQQEGWGLSGIFPFHFHAFWIRLAISWGLVGMVIVLAVVVVLILHRRVSVTLKCLAMLVLVQGLTMGLLYLSNVGVPLILAFALAIFGLPSEKAEGTLREASA